MVLLRFTKLIDKVKDGRKKQTIRKPRKNPIKEGDTLQVYVLYKLGEAKVTSIERKRLIDITQEDALKDGFDKISECIYTLQEMHNANILDEFDIITFDPNWSSK